MKKVIIALFVIFFVWKCGCSREDEVLNTSNRSKDGNSILNSNPRTTNKLLAYNYAEDFIKNRLKSPKTADFPGASEKIKHIVALGNYQYEINS